MPAPRLRVEEGGFIVKPVAFAYAKARTVDHAIELLSGHDGEARVLAGGQSLMATLNMRLSSPSLLVDINGIAGLDQINCEAGRVEIGALVRAAAAEGSAVIGQSVPLVAAALPYVAHPAIRNRGTIGGSVALADPAAELPACLLALRAEIAIAGPGGRRRVPADEFFRGLFETALGPRDVLTGIDFPAAGPGARFGFAELARRHGDYALVGLAAAAQREGEGLTNLRLAFFGVGSTPWRARRAEALLEGALIDPERLDAAVSALNQDLDPSDDLHASAALRRHLAAVILRRVVRQLTGEEPQ